ncbi:MAG: hypothetical protein LC624_07165, partial [Halobacteriales archaeon]|nr:hypothetical protein [Halobacteriales archaeon]
MRSLAFLLVTLLALAALPSLPGAEAQGASPLNPGATVLYLSSTQAVLPGAGNVETLITAPPAADGTEATRPIDQGAGWYALPPATQEMALGDNVTGTIAVDVGPLGNCGALPLPICPALPGAQVNASITLELQKVSANGTATTVANQSQNVQISVNPILPPTNLTWVLSPSNVTLAVGDTLAINMSASVLPPIAPIVVVYNSTAHPSSINVTLNSIVRGGLILTSSSLSKDVAPGGSAVYVVNVRNTAPANTDVVGLSASGQPADWTVRLSSSSVSVPANSVSSVTVTVSAPSGAGDAQQHVATISARGTSGATASLGLTTTARAGGAPGGTADADRDGFTDVDEKRYGSSPTDPGSTPDSTDSDGDGASNKAEIDAACDPFNAQDAPLAGGGCGPAGSGGNGNLNQANTSPLAFLSDPIASGLGVDSATADVIAAGLILLFLLILLLLLFLLLGGYPVKVTLAEARAVTEPGRAADYSVVVHNRLRAPQTVDLEVAQLPNDWDVRFAQPRLQLEGKASESVGLLVRPPDNWPAPSKREFT